MVELWNSIIVEGSSNTDKKDEEFMERNLQEFVNKIYTVLYADKFKYNEMNPTQLALGDPELVTNRALLIDSCIKLDKIKKSRYNQLFMI